jgi:hypothetical protein
MGEVLEPFGFDYEPYKVPYWTPANYCPDWALESVLVEAKGWFRPGDQKKYKAVRDSLPDSLELVFLLQAPNKKVRKGAQLTMSGWCTKEGLRWFSDPEELAKYVWTKEGLE